MKRQFFAFLSGTLFGLGILIAGMGNPAKVAGFLDLFGNWDPSLAFVMAGAIAVAIYPFYWAKKQPCSLTGDEMQLPKNNKVDKRLVIGSLIFGAGWGIAGICPGPAWVLAGSGNLVGLQFLLMMIIGMALFELFNKLWLSKK